MSGSKLRDDALAIFQSGIQAANPVGAVERHVKREDDTLLVDGTPYPLGKVGCVKVVGMGKASAVMAKPLTELLGDLITDGIINVKYGHRFPLRECTAAGAGKQQRNVAADESRVYKPLHRIHLRTLHDPIRGRREMERRTPGTLRWDRHAESDNGSRGLVHYMAKLKQTEQYGIC